MNVKFLGTAAAEAVPALWCECPVCAYARQHGGKDVRRRCSYLIDSDTLIDFGPDAAWQAHEFGIDLTAIRRIVFTHAHVDHLNPVELRWRRPGFSQVSRPLDIYGNARCLERIKVEIDGALEAHRLVLHELQPGVAVSAGDLSVLPVRAAHSAPPELALNFVISRGGRSLLIASDTGPWPEASWQLLAGVRLEAAIIESTGALAQPHVTYGLHLGAQDTVAFRDRLRELGAVTAATRVYTSHFSHNGAPLHHDMEAFFGPHGITVAYDGLAIDV